MQDYASNLCQDEVHSTHQEHSLVGGILVILVQKE
jgi:hypothetical protein